VKIRYRIFLGFFIIIIVVFYIFTTWVIRDMRNHPLKAAEEAMVDTACILASLLESSASMTIDTTDLRAALDKAYRRTFLAQIYEIEKQNVQLRVYVTDGQGLVIFDSDNGRDEGKDYSQWNDVYLTIRGKYGARFSRMIDKDFFSRVLYVAAPIYSGKRIVGVVSVGKPIESVRLFFTQPRKKIIIIGIIACVVAGILTFFISSWITKPIRKLTNYATAIRDGKRVEFPELGSSEIGVLGTAFEEMRDALEGKKYIENYVQTLAHEIKGPLSSIHGASKVLLEDMTPQNREKFINNIQQDNHRIQLLLDRLLQLASLESRKGLQQVEKLDLSLVIEDVLESVTPLLKNKNITPIKKVEHHVLIKGEKFLIRQAIFNLIQNAIDFTPSGGRIIITTEAGPLDVSLAVIDNGSGIPDYALKKVFDKFYSLPRPQTRKKSTGLGLSFVKEVAQLHGGEVKIENNPNGGVKATIQFRL